MTLDELDERIEQIAELPLYERRLARYQLSRAVMREVMADNPDRVKMIVVFMERTGEV